MITELNVVNSCLATIGEMPLVELQDEHPMVAAARQNFEEARVAEVAVQWWFNTDRVTLQPANGEGFIYVPRDAVAVTPLDRQDLGMRGRRLYNHQESTYVIGAPVRCVVVRDIPFDDLPAPAQLLVKHACVLQFQMNYDADEAKSAKLEALYAKAYRTLNAEHIRQVALNGLLIPHIAQARMAVGGNRRIGNRIPVR
ncbi:hypothetical protein fHeYen301_44 [Yersinia phage fHe-Yen3-01]|uniref:Tail tubular protein A n=1 Tax=Yersinia phage fHe-Yen3-01 TaxID=1932893 RepID=A0A1L7DQI5_9CAUD|nr:tail protein [Yersinia phage fHe-Yen3-01]APU00377.1 hypothetical protein fHeYen301_44 [Yersinia phage fHe-Yen3-01]